MALSADAQGFLVGTPVDIGQAMGLWRGIRDDVRAIRRAVDGSRADTRVATERITRAVQAQAQATRQQTRRIPSVTPITPQRSRTVPGTTVTETGLAKAIVKATKADTANSTRARRAVETGGPAGRDMRGRFMKKGGGDGGGGGGNEETKAARSLAAGIRGLAGRMSGALGDGTGELDEADPSVRAFNEIAQPLKRGLGALFGGRDGERMHERWYKRLWRTLTGNRDDEKKTEKKQQKTLDEINAKTGAGGGRGSGLLGMLAPLLSMLRMGGLGGAGALLGGGAGLLGKAGKGAKGLFGKLGGLGKFARKMPIIGPLFSMLMAGSDAVAAEENPELTRRQKDRQVGAAAGGGVGAVVGGVLGTLVGGPLGGIGGALLGDQIGQLIGQEVGLWVNDLRAADIPGKISQTWDDFTTVLSGAWESFTGGLGDIADGIMEPLSKAGEALNKKIEEWTGVDIAESVSEGMDALGDGAQSALSWGTEKASGLWQSVKGGAANLYDVGREKVTRAAAHLTGDVTQNREALRDQMDKMGMTDPEERAMFMAQMDHESQGFTRMEENLNYRSADRLAGINSNARGKSRAELEAAIAGGPEAIGKLLYDGMNGNRAGEGYLFRGRGHVGLTGRSNYEAAGKALGLDLANNPDLASDPKNAAKIAAWYWQSRGLSGKGQAGDVLGTTRGINGGINGLRDRTLKYRDYLNSPLTAPGMSSAIASAPAPRVAPVSTAIPTIAEAPQVSVPLAESAGRGPSTVVVSPHDAGQDVKDRGIAHIVTGGLSSTA